jgi:hypothetical protein
LVGDVKFRTQRDESIAFSLDDGGEALRALHDLSLPVPPSRLGRLLLCRSREQLVALHGFIKRARGTPDEHLALARRGQKELMR